MTNKTIEVALFKTELVPLIPAVVEPGFNKPRHWIQISECVPVVFPMLEDSYVFKEEIKSIDNSIAEIKQEALERIENLNNKKQELLALPNN